ncbi:interferon gamma-like [Salarias fasciatus]|uniref:Interferon gamma-like n=1 Tax=Salarias fasciatus TaxID=181472 RepID=A0A672F6K7_SALFA|nr:interferon gamma-like [Salarias fasciatus]
MVTVARAALCLCVWLFASEVGGSYIPPKMNRTIQNLLQHYKISAKERFNGKPVFSKELLSKSEPVNMVFMGGVLEAYERLLGQMLKQLPTPGPALQATPSGVTTSSAGGDDVRKDLSYILEKVQQLKKARYKQLEELLPGLHSLQHIQMDNNVIQSKALFEFPWLYDEASRLSDTERQKRRRRRHTKSKTFLKG